MSELAANSPRDYYYDFELDDPPPLGLPFTGDTLFPTSEDGRNGKRQTTADAGYNRQQSF